MIWTHRNGVALALLAAAALSTGGCDQEKKQIQYLQQQNLELTNANKDLQGKLAGSRTRESQLMSELDSKDLQLTALQTANQELGQKLSAGPAPGAAAAAPTTPGTEIAVYRETVASDVLFGAGRATLSSAGKGRLSSTASLLRSKYADMAVRVYGYTDSDPIRRTRKLWTDNLDLSANRAMAVSRYLQSKGVAAGRVETIAMGATNFVAANSTKAGKAKNRRVEIVVVKK
jgi:outer membrane protein OmpA-like peptidoglycan-associated protein